MARCPVAFIYPNTMGAWLALFGLLVTVILYARKVPGALVISILVTAIVGLIIGFTEVPETFTRLRASPHSVTSTSRTCSSNSGSWPRP